MQWKKASSGQLGNQLGPERSGDRRYPWLQFLSGLRIVMGNTSRVSVGSQRFAEKGVGLYYGATLGPGSKIRSKKFTRPGYKVKTRFTRSSH